MITIACTVPAQRFDKLEKLAWLDQALQKTACDLFLLPQEYFGGVVGQPNEIHVDTTWVVEQVGELARKYKRHIGVGAACTGPNGGATEDYWYLDDTGAALGRHRKFALPKYDDIRAHGHGQLWPEASFQVRATPINLPKLALKIGTVFCWEVFNMALWAAYAFAGCNLITHPVKFSPRSYPKTSKAADGLMHVDGFGVDAMKDLWQDRLLAASRHEVLCPIAITCNTWNLGEGHNALIGHVDEVFGTTKLEDVPSLPDREAFHSFTIEPKIYNGVDHMTPPAVYKQCVGSLEGFKEWVPYRMHAKIRKIEARLVGGSAGLSLALKASVQGRQLKSVEKQVRKMLGR